MKEIQIIELINNHENIVKVYKIFIWTNNAPKEQISYIKMEKCDYDLEKEI